MELSQIDSRQKKVNSLHCYNGQLTDATSFGLIREVQ